MQKNILMSTDVRWRIILLLEILEDKYLRKIEVL